MTTSKEQLLEFFLAHPKVVTDSRKIAEGSIFFALKGENFDGNQFAKQALEKGAAYAVIDDATQVKSDERLLLVKDVLTSLQELANLYRQRFDIPLIGITGSNGKTTTKELISTVLSTQYKTHFTKGNFNNHIGVPLTLLEIPMDTEVAVIEMGANHVGEIDFLCNIAQPTHGIITNIGKAHLEGFGSLEGVKKAKSELYRYLTSFRGIAFVNRDENYLLDLAAEKLRKIFYLRSENPNKEVAEYEVKFISCDPYVKVAFLSWREELIEAQSQLIGAYNFNNIMTAVAIGKYFKVPGIKIKNAIENYVPQNNRSEIIESESNVFILDAYNANPSSMKEALNNLAQSNKAQKVAILGDMLELGEYSEEEHKAIIDIAFAKSLKDIILVGAAFKEVAQNYELPHFDDVVQLKTWFETKTYENTIFLIKGSRGIRLEKLLK